MKARAEQQKEKEEIIDTRWAYRGHALDLRVDTYRFDQKTRINETIHHPGSVVIVPIDSQGHLLFIKQWRRSINEIVIELPAGTLEEKEDPGHCAQRELQEEIGFRCEKLTPLGGFYSAPGFCDEYLHVFVAEHLLPSPLPPDEDEGIDLFPLPLPKALQSIQKNQIRDAKTIAAVFLYQLR